MRVALVIETFERGAGGVERDAVELVDALATRALELTVVCRRAGVEPPTPVRLEQLGGPAFWQPLRIATFSARAGRATRGRFDVVHSYSRTRQQQIYRAGGGSHAEYLERCYAHPALRRRLSPRHATILSIEEAVFRDPRQIVQCLTHRDAAEIARRYGVPERRLVVTLPGVDTERFHPRNREVWSEHVRRELSLDGPVALFVGSGFARKGLDLAIAGLARAGVKATLLVAGAGDPRPFQRQAESLGVAAQLRFLGVRSDVERLHTAADLLLLPTRYDAFGNAVLEAMASGLAVATTRAAGVAELVESGRSGFVLEHDFAPAFAALARPDELRELGRAARDVAARLTWQRHAGAVLELYARVAT